ncbi:hypothetical protein BDV38DRAFT_182860 [Aspergillus pseudotamarii]|uniref:Uncharacterized protein n=1 Tax=Aspergillus pseudotamarii TaxID=132259 RepID=A0A5N6SFV3_ASPPS|nr:uncharacterized protein BDV38DRAFT_182860 [Aspergillus pseudotamarii]KAE8133608.1 hypothetical protein BDV38DRAFT_182860 [Aspergillus pseudotamarii]
MAPSHSFTLFLSVILAHLCSLALAVPWVVTDYYEQAIVTESHYYTTKVITTIQEVSPTATSLPEAVSTITSIGTGYYAGDATVIQKLYPTGVGKPVDDYDYPYYYSDDQHYTIFKVYLTYSAPTGCATQWTQTTAVPVSPPVVVQDLLPQTSMETSVSVDSSVPFQPTTYTYDVVYVDPTQVPSSTLESLSYYNRPTSLYTGAQCYYTSTDSSRYTGGYYYGYGDDYNWFLDDYYMGISPLALTLILTLGWIGLFLILGFIEAFVRFRRLMTGWQTRRGLPVCWSLTVIPISLLLLCFFRKGYRARSQADAEILKKRWDAMGFWTKLRLFFVWGFRFKYPPMLGPAPARVKTSKQPGKNPGPRLLTPSPSQSVAPDSRQGSTTARSAEDLEMAEASVEPLQHPSQAAVSPSTASGALPSHQDDPIGRAR